jgi:tetratricopeptide (TPR) repeat protein
VCPVGPLIPSRELCLNCGNPYPSDAPDAPCGACGLSPSSCPAALGIADAPADPIRAAREAIAQGLFRRGMAILNSALQEGAELPEAWFLKAYFLNSVGFNRTAAEMLAGALERHTNPADRIALLEEQSFLWAECLRGEEALRSADAALALGSNSLRTHYLRGRALALLGRLEEALEKMNHVLVLDPQNADAHRGRAMIDEALRPKRKAWWQYWK